MNIDSDDKINIVLHIKRIYDVNKFCNKAFTLTEVLLVLAIVGTIATMTIPVLMANVKERENMAMLKKLYSSYTVNITSMLNNEYATSCESLSCLRKWDTAGVHNGALADTRIFNISAECIGNCITDYFGPGTTFPTNDITYSAGSGLNASLYLLPNSAAVMVYDAGGNCTQEIEGHKYCSIVMFDTNGANGPNAPCADRFAFYLANTPFGNNDKNIQANYLVPFGFHNPSSTGNPYNCTARIMRNGWKK